MIAFVVALFLVLLLARVPLFLCIGAVTALCLYLFTYSDIVMLLQPVPSIAEKEALLAVPLFIITSTFMTRGSSAGKLVDFIKALVGWLPGGMALATIGSCLIFAALAGLSPAAIIAVGSTMLPGLVKSGYSERFSLGLVTSSGALGILVPPSIVVLVFAVVAGGTLSVDEIPGGVPQAAPAAATVVDGGLPAWAQAPGKDIEPGQADGESRSGYFEPQAALGGDSAGKTGLPKVTIEALFTAGVVPIALLAFLFTGYAMAAGRKTGYRQPFAGKEILRGLTGGFWPILLPAIICILIIGGYTTVTQAGAIAAGYAFLVEFVIYRTLPLKKLPALLREAGSMIGMLLIIIAATFSFNTFLTAQEVPATLTEWIRTHFHSPVMFLLAVNVLLLLLGCVMDILSAVFITVPLLLPAAVFAMGINPIHFGVIFIVNFEIGYLTPPVGINLFTSGAVFNKPVETVARSVLPFLALMLGALVLITYYPPLSLWLVELTGTG